MGSLEAVNGGANEAVNEAPNESAHYSMLEETQKTLGTLLSLAKSQIPPECAQLAADTAFKTLNTGSPYFPVPFKETEAVSALKAVEAGIAAGIADLRYGEQKRNITVDLERASCFLFSSYLVTIGGKAAFRCESEEKIY